MSIMKITISPAAEAVIDKRIEPKKGFILALNDGSNAYSKIGGSCAIGDKFQILPLSMKNEHFDIKIDNPDFDIYISKEEQVFLGENAKIDFHDRLSNFTLSNESGILDNNMLLTL